LKPKEDEENKLSYRRDQAILPTRATEEEGLGGEKWGLPIALLGASIRAGKKESKTANSGAKEIQKTRRIKKIPNCLPERSESAAVTFKKKTERESRPYHDYNK